jgi:hypothetical protein
MEKAVEITFAKTKRVAAFILLGLSFQFFNNYSLAETEFKHKLTGEPISVIKCTFDKTAYFWIGKKQGKGTMYKVESWLKNIYSHAYIFMTGDRNTELEAKNEDYSFIISDLNTDTPNIKGNLGESQLHILLRTPNTIYLAEVTPGENALNYITLFPKKGVVIFSKQYQMFPPENGEIAAYMSVGHFE